MNDKSILIIDTPKNCNECSLSVHIGFNELVCCFKRIYGIYVDKYDKPYWCPLRKLPEKKNWGEMFNGNVKGWNDCLKEITGESNNE